MRGRKRALVQLAGQDLLVGRLLVQVPVVLERVEVLRSRAVVVGIPARDGVLVDAVLRDVVGAGRGDRPQLLDGREADRHRARERHREKREEIPLRLDQLDRQRVARRDDARDLGRLPVHVLGRSDDVPEELLGRRGHVAVERSLEGVLHALSGDEAVLRWRELEVVADLERVRPLVGRDRRHRRCDLRRQARRLMLIPRSVGVVDELRAGRVLEFPGGRDVRDCRIDLHRRTGHADSKRVRPRRLRRGRDRSCSRECERGEAEEQERNEPSGLLCALHVSPPLTRAN